MLTWHSIAKGDDDDYILSVHRQTWCLIAGQLMIGYCHLAVNMIHYCCIV